MAKKELSSTDTKLLGLFFRRKEDHLTGAEVIMLTGKCRATVYDRLNSLYWHGFLDRKEKCTNKGKCVMYKINNKGYEWVEDFFGGLMD